MIEYMIDKTDEFTGSTAPPTRETIERLRAKQLAALKVLRRRLLEVRESDRSAA